MRHRGREHPARGGCLVGCELPRFTQVDGDSRRPPRSRRTACGRHGSGCRSSSGTVSLIARPLILLNARRLACSNRPWSSIRREKQIWGSPPAKISSPLGFASRFPTADLGYWVGEASPAFIIDPSMAKVLIVEEKASDVIAQGITT